MSGPRSDTVPGQLFDLSGRVAVVTGATGVLGGAMARGLADAGARVGVAGRREERAKEVAQEISNSGAEATAVPADASETKAATPRTTKRVELVKSLRSIFFFPVRLPVNRWCGAPREAPQRFSA